jgi:hypothetical protein
MVQDVSREAVVAMSRALSNAADQLYRLAENMPVEDTQRHILDRRQRIALIHTTTALAWYENHGLTTERERRARPKSKVLTLREVIEVADGMTI